MKLYGIPNCDTVKKARTWLTEHGHEYDWHDYKKLGVTAELLAGWIAQSGWEPLVNKAGTTWRKLDEASKAAVVDADSAIALMLAHPSVIKRPVLDRDGRITVGYKPETYDALFSR
ncbi:ArsC family reductase [Jeongeupia naejangsanensis]|uniref:ArsC family reductase n=1 Tax=Jeongeupia naejangsanensis TaxID=613195 RepID=A0ABS2BFY8_9NEIS|nr:ArsC family reductase [Jeongeupia naejangsanensis]MBM3114522.1 ArsC family reductase [Jeongeupia naejangsanensis]